ncbi:replication initiation protein, partial [Acinetobacter variabilis]
METDLIAKQANKLIESVYRMEVEEQKVILLATKKVNDIELRGLPFTPETEIVITADDFVRAYGVNKQRAFEALVSAKNTIYDRSFEIDYVDVNGETKPISSRWIHAKGEMKHKSAISMFFTPAVIPFIYLVVKEEFTLIDLREVGRLKSKYAVRLYQLLMKWRNANHQPIFTIEVLRKKLGLAETEYLQFGDFNKRVIQVAVDQINKGTGFTELKAIPKKEGRKVVSFRFEYKEY